VVCDAKTNRPGEKGLLKTILYYRVMPQCWALQVLVFLQRFFHVVEIMGVEGHEVKISSLQLDFFVCSLSFLRFGRGDCKLPMIF